MRPTIAITISLLFVFSFSALSQQRSLEIKGTKNYTEDELIEQLGLDAFERGRMDSKEVINAITSFYSQNGYTLLKIYIIEHTDEKLSLYIDEGALDKIVFLNMDDFSTIYLMFAFRLKNKIFNIKTIEKNIEKLRKFRPWKNIVYQLVPTKEYDSSLFQIDRELNLPLAGKFLFPLFDRFPPRYDLIVYVKKDLVPEEIQNIIKNSEKDKNTTGAVNASARGELGKEAKRRHILPTLNRIDLGIKVHFYKGFIPFIKYYHLGLIAPGDFFNAESSVGIMYGIDRKFKRPPRETYASLHCNYFLPPALKDYFTPHVRFFTYHSRAARPDLALASYNFLVVNGMLAPGITLLSKINMYIGLGTETVFFYNSNVFWWKLATYSPTDILLNNPQKQIETLKKTLRLLSEIEKRADVYLYAEGGIIYDFAKRGSQIYELRKNRLKKELAFIYDYFFLKQPFHRINANAYFDHEFKDRSIYSGILSYHYTFTSTPFYQEASVSNPAFKGLNATSYFTRHMLCQSNEYRVSMYRDVLYVGVFFDMTLFEGSGHDLTGAQFAISGGPTFRILLLDHFELYLHYCWDLLASTKKSKQYFHFNLQNRW